MKEIVKNKIKVIALILIGVIIGSTITVYATGLVAKDITYVRDNEEITVERALNELYARQTATGYEEYEGKPYITTGLTMYKDRIEILNGGYYTDEEGVNWVNITFKAKTTMSGDGQWTVITGIPSISEKFAVLDTSKKYAFFIGNSNGLTDTISFYVWGGYGIANNQTITLKFKY